MEIDLRMFGNHDDSNKIVVDYLAVKIDVTRKDNNYYTILYRPINSNQTYEGYGTDNPYFINAWLEKYFIVKKKGDVE